MLTAFLFSLMGAVTTPAPSPVCSPEHTASSGPCYIQASVIVWCLMQPNNCGISNCTLGDIQGPFIPAPSQGCSSVVSSTAIYDKDQPGVLPNDVTLKADGYIVGDHKCTSTGVWQITKLGSCGFGYSDAGFIQ